MKLIESKTYINLAKSFASECMARTRYEFIEYGARQQGLNALAEVIDKVVYNEFNHARMFYTHLQKASEESIENIDICSGYPFKEKWDLQENLRLAAEDEKIEAEEVYPTYMRIAQEEGFTDIAEFYKNLIQIETCHHKLFTDLYTQMKKDTMYKKPKAIKWKCSGCGYESIQKDAWDICPVCSAKQGVVMLELED